MPSAIQHKTQVAYAYQAEANCEQLEGIVVEDVATSPTAGVACCVFLCWDPGGAVCTNST